MTAHMLKTWPTYFDAVWTGDKPFEIRYEDRGYQRGDTVLLREWDRDATCLCDGHQHRPDCHRYTGREIRARIGFVLASTPARGSQRGFNGNGYVVFSLCDLELLNNHDPTPEVHHLVSPSQAITRVAHAGGLD